MAKYWEKPKFLIDRLEESAIKTGNREKALKIAKNFSCLKVTGKRIEFLDVAHSVKITKNRKP